MVANAIGITGAVAVTQPPAGALPHGVVADLGFDLVVAHSGIVIPGGIVSADVVEAKPVIVMEIEPGFGRTEISAGDAAGMIAKPHRSVGRALKGGI
jgi:hypothetical protein